MFKILKKENIDLVLPFWMVLFYAFFLGILIEEVGANEIYSSDVKGNINVWFWTLIGCFYGIYAGIKYPVKKKLGFMAGLSIIGAPIMIGILAPTVICLFHDYWEYTFMSYITSCEKALNNMR